MCACVFLYAHVCVCACICANTFVGIVLCAHMPACGYVVLCIYSMCSGTCMVNTELHGIYFCFKFVNYVVKVLVIQESWVSLRVMEPFSALLSLA